MAGYRIKITLKDTKPPVWRRVIIPEKITFRELHEVIQILFGWGDMHLHAFTFSDDKVEIAGDIKDATGEAFLEEQVLVDEYINDNRYIEYTYDFGDDWQHRIVLEEVVEDYAFRYATLMKYKGNNFPEDSGGVWGFDEEEYAMEIEEFQADEVQAALGKWKFPVHVQVERQLSYDDDIEDMDSELPEELLEFANVLKEATKIYEESNDLEKTLQFLEKTPIGEKFVQEIRETLQQEVQKERKKESRLEKECRKWEDFCTEFYEGTEAKQLEFQFDGNANEAYKVSGCLVKEKGNHTIADNLNQYGDVKRLREYCKYLQIGHRKNASKKELAKKIEEALLRNPKYIVTLFDEDTWKCFFDYIQNDVMPENFEEQLGVYTALQMGLIEIRYRLDVGMKTAYIKPACNLMEIMEQISDEKVSKWLEERDRFFDSVSKYLLMYNCISFAELYRLYTKEQKTIMPQEQFYEKLYWYLRMRGLILTAALSTGEINYDCTFAAINEIDIAYVGDYVIREMGDWEYKRFRQKDYTTLLKGYNLYYPEWDQLLIVLEHLGDQESTGEVLSDLFAGVRNGWDTYDVLEYIYDCYDVKNIPDFADLWYFSLSVVMHTEIPMLKAHSREEYYKRMKTWPPMLHPIEVDAEFDLSYEEFRDADAEDSISDFPAAVQLKLYEILESSQEPVSELEKLPKFYMENAEWLYLLAKRYMEWNNMQKAADLFIKLEETFNDEGIREASNGFFDLYDTYTENLKREILYGEEVTPLFKGTPYVRSEKKVGRNDPCPCGSGKKYKHCCGR